MQDTNPPSAEPTREPYEKPVCRVNMFTVEDSLMISGGKRLDNAEPGSSGGESETESNPWSW